MTSIERVKEIRRKLKNKELKSTNSLIELIQNVQHSIDSSNDLMSQLKNSVQRGDIKDIQSLIKNIKLQPNINVNVDSLDKVEKLLATLIKNADKEIVVPPINWPKDPEDAIPVVLTDKDKEKFYTVITSALGGGWMDTSKLATKLNQQAPSTGVTIYNVTLTDADTEYTQLLPNNTKGLRFRCRTLYDVRYAWESGRVAVPTAPYSTLPAAMDYFADGLNLVNQEIYFASSQAGVVVELEVFE